MTPARHTPRERTTFCRRLQRPKESEQGAASDQPWTVGGSETALVQAARALAGRLAEQGGAALLFDYGTIALEAANPAYETRLFRDDQVKVQGRLVGLIRTY